MCNVRHYNYYVLHVFAIKFFFFFNIIYIPHLASGNYIQRQTERWSRQYEASKTHPIPSMDRLVTWLPGRAPSNHATTVVHGDFR